MKRAIRAVNSLVFLTAWLGLACATRREGSTGCSVDGLQGTWDLQMTSRGIVYSVTGSIALSAGAGQTHLIGETSEGTTEPIDYPIQGLRVSGDSVFFSFAPIGFSLQGRCVTPARLEGRFSVPNPPFDSIVGDWVARRAERR